jgi:hypothetical protein
MEIYDVNDVICLGPSYVDKGVRTNVNSRCCQPPTNMIPVGITPFKPGDRSLSIIAKLNIPSAPQMLLSRGGI